MAEYMFPNVSYRATVYRTGMARVIERHSINVDEPIIGVTTVAATTPDKVH